MKRVLAIIPLLALFAGCSTLRYSDSRPSSSSWIEQDLRYQAVEKACALVLESDSLKKMKDEAAAIQDKIDHLKKYQPEMSALAIEKLGKKLGELSRNVDEAQNKENQTNKILALINGDKRIFVQLLCEEGRHYVYSAIIEKELLKYGAKVADNEKDADYRVRVLITKEGVDTWDNNILFLFRWPVIKAEADADIDVYDYKSNSVIYRVSNHGSAEYKNAK